MHERFSQNMLAVSLRYLTLALLYFVTHSALASQPASTLSELLTRLQAQGFNGVVIAGADHEPAREWVIGYADQAAHRLHAAGESWPWASVTKQLTATLVMQEVERGSLQLDTPIRTYLPEFPGPSASTLTLRHLLKHTSGLPNPDDTAADAEEVPAFYRESGPQISNRSRTLGYCAATPKMEPGAGYSALGVWSYPARLTGCAATVPLVERHGGFAGVQVRNLLAPALNRALIVFVNNASFDFGQIWQGKGALFDLASAAFCSAD